MLSYMPSSPLGLQLRRDNQGLDVPIRMCRKDTSPVEALLKRSKETTDKNLCSSSSSNWETFSSHPNPLSILIGTVHVHERILGSLPSQGSHFAKSTSSTKQPNARRWKGIGMIVHKVAGFLYKDKTDWWMMKVDWKIFDIIHSATAVTTEKCSVAQLILWWISSQRHGRVGQSLCRARGANSSFQATSLSTEIIGKREHL